MTAVSSMTSIESSFDSKGSHMSDILSRDRFLRAAGGAAAGLAAPSVARAQTRGLTPVQVLIAASDGVTAVVYAKSAGLFEKAGLDVQLSKQSNGAAVAAGVASGSYDIGNSSLTSLLLAHQNGLPFTFIAPAGLYTDARIPFAGALVLKDSTMRFDSDVNGQTIGVVSLTGLGQVGFCAFIDQNGGDWRSVKFVELPFAAIEVALTARRVVAAESITPALERTLASKQFKFVKIYGAIAPTYAVSTWFTTRDFSAKHPDVVRRFSRVVRQSAAYCNAHHAETAPLMADFIGIPVNDFANVSRAVLGTTIDPALIQPVIVAGAKYGNLRQVFSAREMIDPNAES
jgi:NitT/TauT family transport system substrate-binding protein